MVSFISQERLKDEERICHNESLAEIGTVALGAACLVFVNCGLRGESAAVCADKAEKKKRILEFGASIAAEEEMAENAQPTLDQKRQGDPTALTAFPDKIVAVLTHSISCSPQTGEREYSKVLATKQRTGKA